MAEAIFYVLPDTGTLGRAVFACKLVEKAYRNGQLCYIQTADKRSSQQLDDLLWTFRAGSFVPHQIFESGQPILTDQVLIGNSSPPEGWQELVINLSEQFPEHPENYGRIVEILDADESVKARGREHYKRYHQKGVSVITHKL